MATKQDAIQIANEIFDFLANSSLQRLSLHHPDLEAKELRKKNEEEVIEINKDDKPEEIQMGSYTITYKPCEVSVRRKGQRVYQKKDFNHGARTVIFD